MRAKQPLGCAAVIDKELCYPPLYIGYRYAQPMYAPLGAKDAT